MRLLDLLRPSLICVQLVETKRTAAVREIASLLKNDPRVKDFEKFYQDILAREREENTYLGFDTAMPHARTESVGDMVLAIGRSPKGVFFENCNQTAKLLFVIGTPKKMATEYLRLVGTIARLLKKDDVRNGLLAAETPEEFSEILSGAELKL